MDLPKAQMSLERKHICRGTRSDASMRRTCILVKISKGDTFGITQRQSMRKDLVKEVKNHCLLYLRYITVGSILTTV